jgi:cytochrome c biogenesis protein CcdA
VNGVSLGFAFSAGLIASLNPCAFAMLPAFAAYYLGLDEGQAAPPSPPRRLARALLVGSAMTAGFVVVFAAIGALVSLAGSGLLRYQDIVAVVVAVALAGLGAWLAGGRELRVFVPNPVRGKGGRDLLSAGLYGVGYGFASLACTLPIFLIVVGAAFLEGSVAGGLLLFLAYSAGMGAIVMAVSLGTALFKGVVARFLRRALPHVQRLSGALLILAGTYLAVRQLDQARLGTLSGLRPYATVIGAGLAAGAVLAAALLRFLGGERLPEEQPVRVGEKTAEPGLQNDRELELSGRA